MAKKRPDVLIYLFFLLYVAFVIIAFLCVLSESLSTERAALSGTVGVFPDIAHIQFDAYRKVLSDKDFLHALLLTSSITVLGTLAALVTTIGAAYALSVKNLFGRRTILILFLFSMVFSGGLIPTYLTLEKLNLINTYRLLWIAGAFSVSNMLLLKAAFEAVPKELAESAVIDGCGHWRLLIKVYIPSSGPVLAVVALFYAIGYWNNYYTSMMFTTRGSLKSLQLLLKDIVYTSGDQFKSVYGSAGAGEVTSLSTVAASIVVSIIPVLILYPVISKYFHIKLQNK